ncbi:hypothetical protein SCHPADRAFT_911798 [Schizopora paradoxa]|uniref:Uncharacterized protein n=1 Tax=Schizopora paradoxa TaxID=27342 RepID=A0A0H2QXT5_9AGAM|nr:hypothetical protein SCHPADRAFT_911798 [Schizopora paradoxa]
MHSWYDDQPLNCDEMMVVEIARAIRKRIKGVPYFTVFGRVAPNACNVCYNTLRPEWFRSSEPTLRMMTYRCSVLYVLTLPVKPKPDSEEYSAEDGNENSFEGGFRIARKEIIQAEYLKR